MKNIVHTVNLTNLRIAWTCPVCQHRNHMTPCQYDFDVDLGYNHNLGECSCPGDAYPDGITFGDKCQKCERIVYIKIPQLVDKKSV